MATRLRTDRGPDGRLLFDWCAECFADVHSQALGLSDPTPDPPPIRGRPPGTEAEVRSIGLRTMGLVLVVWGLVLEVLGAATWLGFGPAENGFGPSRINRLQIFSSAGIVLAVAGAWVGLASVDRALRRRSIARAIEAISIGGAVGVLILGILFHDPKRDPWIVGVVAIACVASWAARQWSRPRGSQADRIAS